MMHNNLYDEGEQRCVGKIVQSEQEYAIISQWNLISVLTFKTFESTRVVEVKRRMNDGIVSRDVSR